jgi:hypothetical protein
MNRIKIFSLTLVLSLVGIVYAGGGNAQTTARVSVQDQPSASCCSPGADCCSSGAASCCARHKSDHKNHSTQPSEAGNKSCCASGASLCPKHKADGKRAAGESCDALNHQGGANCCGGEGAGCCAEGACSTAEKQ